MKRRQRRPFEALGQVAVDETQMALDDDRFDTANGFIEDAGRYPIGPTVLIE
jgi:hypothetical protein